MTFTLLIGSLVLSASSQDSAYSPKNEQIPSPACLSMHSAWEGRSQTCSGQTHQDWLKDVTHWRMERRIRINTTAPCPTATAFMEQSIPVLGQEFIDNFPYPVLHRMATAEEQAWPLILLNSSLNAAVTGALLTMKAFTS